MVGSARKRESVVHLQRALELNERRARNVVGQPLSTQPFATARGDDDEQLWNELRESGFLRRRARYRTAAQSLHRIGRQINYKWAQQLRGEEGLKAAIKGQNHARLSTTAQGRQSFRTNQPNEVRNCYFLQNMTRNGRRLKLQCAMDKHIFECLANDTARWIRAVEVIEVLAGLINEQGALMHLQSNSGPDFLALALRGWLSSQQGSELLHSPGKPMGEGLLRLVQQPATGSVALPKRVCIPSGSEGLEHQMATVLQQGETTFGAWEPDSN